jgi:hypothetical protein
LIVVANLIKTLNFRYGATPAEAGAKFFILDEHGLITKARPNLKQMEENFYDLVKKLYKISRVKKASFNLNSSLFFSVVKYNVFKTFWLFQK